MKRPRRRASLEDEGGLGLYYIPASAASRIGTRTLKQGDSFVVLDGWGDAQASGPAAEGFFHEDMRHLSSLLLLINGERPLLLSSRVTRDNTVLAIDLANPDLYDEGHRVVLARDQVHLLRSKVLEEGACFERIDIHNFAEHPVSLTVQFGFSADFADMFEVRGQHRTARGELLDATVGRAETVLAYLGRDGVERRTHLAFDPPPVALSAREARYEVRLAPHGATTITLTLRCARAGLVPSRSRDFAECAAGVSERMAGLHAMSAAVSSSNTAFNAWLERSEADLDMLVTDRETGPYPYAGIPWFNTAFGRDGIIAALETIWAMPHLAKGVLALLASMQATEIDPARDAEPGKILHETRTSEMAATGEVPFARYYGTVDATPLFVVLAGAYFERTGDRAFVQWLWPHIEAALKWMHAYGDPDGDGFLEYDRRSDKGLSNQGWKDSGDAIFHANGRLAEPPIALVEVQAYFYAALRSAAQLAIALGKADMARALEDEAHNLRRRFEDAFWCEEIGSYALALDGAKRPCCVRSSNAGHALFARIAEPARAARVAATLMSPPQFSGWGVRTIGTGERRYNPMSYHNGSVWPHDNGLIAMGFAHYGLRAPLLRLFDAMFDAATFFELHRLPELFCGFERRAGEGPTLYPVACNPQAWSSAASYALLGAALGISFHAETRQIRFLRPVMLRGLDEIKLERLRFDGVGVDLMFRRNDHEAALNVLRKEGDLEIVLTS